MLRGAMRSSLRRLLPPALALVAAVALTGCGEEGISVSSSDKNYRGAQLFDLKCSGCHTIGAAGAQGSASDVDSREYKDGPNFNQRKEDYEDILYAIRNGGFSSGPMPQNIVVGKEAEAVARFVEEYSGRAADRPTEPGAKPTGTR